MKMNLVQFEFGDLLMFYLFPLSKIIGDEVGSMVACPKSGNALQGFQNRAFNLLFLCMLFNIMFFCLWLFDVLYLCIL